MALGSRVVRVAVARVAVVARRSRPIRASLGALCISLSLAACSVDAGTPAGEACDIAAELAAIPGLSATEAPSMLEGYRFFRMTYEQPEDHANPTGARLSQRFTLLHRDCSAPNVIHNGGYFVSQTPTALELTRMTGANQLAMEHRFFGPSRATPADWSKLDIAQAAADQHRVIGAFKAIYRGRWISTGTSKGGMTSIFHRRFYADDVDGTVAYVAPIMYEADLVPTRDNRFVRFVDTVGSDAACRQQLREFQRLVLMRRDAMKTAMAALAASQNTVYDRFLGPDKALEFSIEQMPFLFWQYGTAEACANIPSETATDAEVFSFFNDAASVIDWADASLDAFLPFYHHAARELGYSSNDESHLTDLLRYPGQDVPRSYVPAEYPLGSYSDASMRDVQSWLRTEGRAVLLLYGQNDPWTAGAFELGSARDSFRFDVPGGNHRAKILDLPEPDRSAALGVVGRWAGVTARVPPMTTPALTELGSDAVFDGPRRGPL